VPNHIAANKPESHESSAKSPAHESSVKSPAKKVPNHIAANKPESHESSAKSPAHESSVKSPVEESFAKSPAHESDAKSPVPSHVAANKPESHESSAKSPVDESSVKSPVNESSAESQSHESSAKSPVQKPSDESTNEVQEANGKEVDATMYAFSANLAANTSYSDETTMVFGTVLANIGGLYINNSGQFVCPDDGLFVFMWSIQKADSLGYPNMRCITSLRQSNVIFKNGPKTTYYSTVPSGSTEMMTVLQCTQLTAVTIVTESWSDSEQLSAFDSKSSFSGFKLQSSIAFTAEVSTPQDLFPDGKVIFGRVLADFGDNYDPIHGFFRCPDDGIYAFSVSAYTTNSTTPWSVSRLMKEGQLVVNGPITYIATATIDSGSSSITAVVQCTAGHSVYVETQKTHHFQFNSYAPTLTSFTGFKLYDASDSNAVAFTAVMSANFTAASDLQNFPINQVVTNIGNAYDGSLFAFICPDTDFYMFTWTSASVYGGEADVALFKEDQQIRHLYLSPQTVDNELGTSGSSTHSAIVQCSASNRFQLKLLRASGRVFLGGYTLFSGYKLPGDFIP